MQAPNTKALLAVAAGLGATAFYNDDRAKAAEREQPPIGGFVAVDGVELRYLDLGRGSPIVLVHGNGSMIEDMIISGIVDRLAARHRVIAFDRPGFGFSQRPRNRGWTPADQARLLDKALDRLGIENPIVYGHSFGTQVAVHMALRAPGRIAGLVLGSGYYFPSPRLSVPLLAAPALPIVGDAIRHTLSPLLTTLFKQRIYTKLFAPSPVTPAFQREFPFGLLRRPSQIRAAAADTAYLVPAAEGLQRRFGELKLPVVIVVGTGDEIVDAASQSIRLHDVLPQSRLVTIADAGHMIHHIAPDAVIEAIESLAARSGVSAAVA